MTVGEKDVAAGMHVRTEAIVNSTQGWSLTFATAGRSCGHS